MTRTEFEHIAAQLRQRVLNVGLDFFGNQEDAEDAAQETMVQLWRYCEHIDAERNVEALAVKMAKNCCVSGIMPNQGMRSLIPSRITQAPLSIQTHRHNWKPRICNGCWMLPWPD